ERLVALGGAADPRAEPLAGGLIAAGGDVAVLDHTADRHPTGAVIVRPEQLDRLIGLERAGGDHLADAADVGGDAVGHSDALDDALVGAVGGAHLAADVATPEGDGRHQAVSCGSAAGSADRGVGGGWRSLGGSGSSPSRRRSSAPLV